MHEAATVHSAILQPVVVLVGWTLAIMIFLFIKRMPALKAAGIDMSKARGGRPGILDGMVPDQAQWPAHNYMHLLEQPTIFYAIALVLAFSGLGEGINAWLAWAYVGLRIVHSLIQISTNQISLRFSVFLLSSIVLLLLTIHAGIGVFS
jgi:hypothetical protein